MVAAVVRRFTDLSPRTKLAMAALWVAKTGGLLLIGHLLGHHQ